MVKNYSTSALFLLVLTALFLGSCGTDDPGDNGITDIEEGVLVLNEGGFQKGNSSLAFIATDSGNVRTKLYESANNKALGDVGQSFTFHNDKLYVVLNNSKQIKVLGEDFIEQNVIEGFTSPRFFLPVNNNRAYASDLFANAVTVVDLNTNMISGSIAIKGMTEKMAINGNDVYITNNSSNYVYVVDIQSDAVTDSIDVGGKNDEIYNYNSNIVVIRNADTDNNIKPAFVTINPNTKEVSNTVEFNASATVWDAKSTLYENNIYFVHEGAVMKYDGTFVNLVFSITGAALPYNIFLYNEKVYIGDAKDFSSTGAVLEYDMNGNLLNTFSTGIIPSSMMWAEF
jgi:YVTN family beta-propeller protein